jgi:hypothetical protein
MAPRSALAAAAAAAVLSVAHGLGSLPAAGVPCSTLDPGNPQYPTCTNTWVPTDYYARALHHGCCYRAPRRVLTCALYARCLRRLK